MQIVNNFALEPYSKLCSFHNLFVNRNVCQKFRRLRAILTGLIDLPKFSYEDLEEIVAGGQVSFGVYWYASRYIHTHYAYAIAFIVYSI